MYRLHCIEFIQTFYTDFKKEPLKGCPKEKCFQNICSLFVNICERRVTFFSKFVKWRPVSVLKINSHTDILSELCLDFNKFLTFLFEIFTTPILQ